MTREEKLSHGKIGKIIFEMGIPTFVAQLINVLYNIVDRIYIGHIEGIGTSALTGVGLTFPIIIFISAFSNLLGAGGAPLAGIALGEGNRSKAEKILTNAFVTLIIISLMLTALFLIIKKPFLYMFGASDATYPYADQYITIYLFGTVFVQLALGLNPYITAQGQAKIAMLSVLIGAVMNIILDPIFIFAFNMGVKGAAIATVLSQFASAVWVLYFLMYSKNATMKIQTNHLKPNLRIIISIAALGISPFIMTSTESLITVIFNSGMQKYGGDLYVGSITILQSVLQLITTPIGGFAQGVQPIISYNFGAGNRERVKKTFYLLFTIVVSAYFVLIGIVMLFPKGFAAMFTDSIEMITLLKNVMPIFFAGMLIFGIQSACQNAFMALGQAGKSLFMALFRKVILLSPLALLLPIVSGGNVMSIYWAEPISDALSAIVCGILFFASFNSILDKREKQLAELNGK